LCVELSVRNTVVCGSGGYAVVIVSWAKGILIVWQSSGMPASLAKDGKVKRREYAMAQVREYARRQQT